ncbi:hypothetical protein C21_00007 [Arenibacter sp. NBRC 103722]|nr:hypothetical protein C21_00007 [Arenibacter sp. NBRC 103722]
MFIACLFGRQVFQMSYQPDKVILAGVTYACAGMDRFDV